MKFDGDMPRPTRIDIEWDGDRIADIKYHFNDIEAPWTIREFVAGTEAHTKLGEIEHALRTLEPEPAQYEPPEVLDSPDGSYVRYGGFHENGYLFEAWVPADNQAIPQVVLRAFKDNVMVGLKRFDLIRHMFPEVSIEDQENIVLETGKFVKDVTLGS